VITREIFHLPLKSSCCCTFFISCGCMLLITLNRDCTAESTAILLPRCELLLMRFTNISTLLFNAFKNCSESSSVSPFWYTWGNNQRWLRWLKHFTVLNILDQPSSIIKAVTKWASFKVHLHMFWLWMCVWL